MDKVIRENVLSGFGIRKELHHMAEEFSYEELHCINHINVKRARVSLGTLGGGCRILQKAGKLPFKRAVKQFSVAHNYLDVSGILRKGAISARNGEQVIIPINMKDGIILGIGKGNAEWNESAPHGSGRRLKRTDVKEQYTVSEFKKEMKGIYSSCVGKETLDEAPFAYRTITDIAEQIKDTVELTEKLKPIYNFKAGSKK